MNANGTHGLPSGMSCIGGSTDLQTSMTFGQRVWKRQPGGGRSALGISPEMICWPRCASISGSAIGTAASSACV